MQSFPPRRWFQFRLSTWFVLVGIVALSANDVIWLSNEIKLQYDIWRAPPLAKRWIEALGRIGDVEKSHVSFVDEPTRGYPSAEDWERFAAEEVAMKARQPAVEDPALEQPHFLLPALTVAAFLAWKAAWAVIERRRRQSTA
jgi:hypothetical protein